VRARSRRCDQGTRVHPRAPKEIQLEFAPRSRRCDPGTRVHSRAPKKVQLEFACAGAAGVNIGVNCYWRSDYLCVHLQINVYEVAEQERLKTMLKEFEDSLSKFQKDASVAQDKDKKLVDKNEALEAQVSICWSVCVYRGWMLAACGKTQTLAGESIPAIVTTILHVCVCR